MPVAEKTHHMTKKGRRLISVSEEKASVILAYAKSEDPAAYLVGDMDNQDTYSNAQASKWYKETKASWHPGITLRIRRENAGMTQAQLARITGLAISNISAIETGHRSVGTAVAKRLAEALHRPVAEFIEPTT